MESDAVIKDLINNPATSVWLSNALKSALNRDPLEVASDAELLTAIFAKRAQEQAAKAITWLVVQRAQSR